MESVLGRYRNLVILVGVLFLQVLGLAVQVKRSTENQSSRLIRVWAVAAVTPVEKGLVGLQQGVRGIWQDYFYLRGVRKENRELKEQIEQLRIEQVRLNEDAMQARRLQALLGFKEQYISKTLAAQVIGTSGTEQSRSVFIDKGQRDGVKPDMAVITGDGVVGKVLNVWSATAQVLLINDFTSGAGAIIEKSRVQGVVAGSRSGEVTMNNVMSDETVQPGEAVVTSGGDRIFPKGLPIGTVTKVSPGHQLFLDIRVRPAADLAKLEEVLVVTQMQEREPDVAENGQHLRAADVLAQRLPSVPDSALQSDPFAAPPSTAQMKFAVPPPTSNLPAPGVQKSSGTGTNSDQTTVTKPIAPVSTQKPATGTVGTAQNKAANPAVVNTSQSNSTLLGSSSPSAQKTAPDGSSAPKTTKPAVTKAKPSEATQAEQPAAPENNPQ
jgi:rod shape-determining protein MreC